MHRQGQSCDEIGRVLHVETAAIRAYVQRRRASAIANRRLSENDLRGLRRLLLDRAVLAAIEGDATQQLTDDELALRLGVSRLVAGLLRKTARSEGGKKQVAPLSLNDWRDLRAAGGEDSPLLSRPISATFKPADDASCQLGVVTFLELLMQGMARR